MISRCSQAWPPIVNTMVCAQSWPLTRSDTTCHANTSGDIEMFNKISFMWQFVLRITDLHLFVINTHTSLFQLLSLVSVGSRPQQGNVICTTAWPSMLGLDLFHYSSEHASPVTVGFDVQCCPNQTKNCANDKLFLACVTACGPLLSQPQITKLDTSRPGRHLTGHVLSSNVEN